MIINNNTILLSSQNGSHEEYVLDPVNTGLALPGSVVTLLYKSTEESTYVSTDSAKRLPNEATTAQKNAALDAIELLIIKENALIGASINRPSQAGETILVQRAVTGDRYLVRVVAGVYEPGDPLYLTQTTNGIYFTKVLGGAPTVRAIALEAFSVTAEIVDKVDRSTTDGVGTNEVPNGGLVNLLKVRIA
ncbi:MAG: hypothetical protein LBP59_11080 [Planctomycetaceae bacterium]|nr:hypothetical protein [Planctomycetaceae bacterium]